MDRHERPSVKTILIVGTLKVISSKSNDRSIVGPEKENNEKIERVGANYMSPHGVPVN